jgi:hypothetical protein
MIGSRLFLAPFIERHNGLPESHLWGDRLTVLKGVEHFCGWEERFSSKHTTELDRNCRIWSYPVQLNWLFNALTYDRHTRFGVRDRKSFEWKEIQTNVSCLFSHLDITFWCFDEFNQEIFTIVLCKLPSLLHSKERWPSCPDTVTRYWGVSWYDWGVIPFYHPWISFVRMGTMEAGPDNSDHFWPAGATKRK